MHKRLCGPCTHSYSPPNLRWEYSLWTWIVLQNNGPKIMKCHIDNAAAIVWEKSKEMILNIQIKYRVKYVPTEMFFSFFLLFGISRNMSEVRILRCNLNHFHSFSFLSSSSAHVRMQATKHIFLHLPKMVFLIGSVIFLIWNLFHTSRIKVQTISEKKNQYKNSNFFKKSKFLNLFSLFFFHKFIQSPLIDLIFLELVECRKICIYTHVYIHDSS